MIRKSGSRFSDKIMRKQFVAVSVAIIIAASLIFA
jgi:hypothetical protein